MNDGKNFISNHKELLEKRLQLKYHSTHIIIQDYNQVDVMNALTRKNGPDTGRTGGRSTPSLKSILKSV